MITRVALVPQAPLLVPELAPGLAEELGELRDAVDDAVRRLRRGSPHWSAVGAGDARKVFESDLRGSFAGYGADVPVRLGSGGEPGQGTSPGVGLPLPVLVAGWLRARAEARAVRVELVPGYATASACVATARRAGEHDTALLVLGDGAAAHGAKAPLAEDDRAAGFDAAVARALATVDAAALLGLDAQEAAELGAVGRVGWQVASAVADANGGAHHWRGELLYSAAPFGVGYHVAVWERQ